MNQLAQVGAAPHFPSHGGYVGLPAGDISTGDNNKAPTAVWQQAHIKKITTPAIFKAPG